MSLAYEGSDGGNARQRLTSAAVEDLRRSLKAQSAEEGALQRAIRRPLTIERLGRHPLGNLVIASVATAFGDYGRASTWLGEQLGIGGAVLPATVEPAQLQIDVGEDAARVARALANAANPGVHDPERLRSALLGLIGSRPAGTVGSQRSSSRLSRRR